MKRICSIIRDLLPNYIENLVSDETKQYVENHLTKCTECKQILENIEGDDTEKIFNTLGEEAEIRFIKKHKRKKVIFKTIGIILLIIFFIVLITFSIRFIPVNSVRLKAYDKLQKLKEMDNYKVTVEKTINVLDEVSDKSTITYYYKDGKYKEDNKRIFINQYNIEEGLKPVIEHKILYYSDGNSNIVTLNKETGNMNISDTASQIDKGHILENLYPLFIKQYHINLLGRIYMAVEINVREDMYDNKKYYVLTETSNSVNTIAEYWINKETMMIEREVTKQESDSFRDEKNKYITYDIKYKIEPNVVTDEDVTFTDNESTLQTDN